MKTPSQVLMDQIVEPNFLLLQVQLPEMKAPILAKIDKTFLQS